MQRHKIMKKYKAPYILHLISFQNAPTHHTPYLKRSRQSIEKYFSNWDIRYWNEDDFLYIISLEDWSMPNAAYLIEIGAWAIISDIIRLYALYTYGGVYADWDVEFVQSIPDTFFSYALTLGFEPYTYNGRGTAQVGMQVCISTRGQCVLKDVFEAMQKSIWTKQFDILPGLCTRVLEQKYGLPSPRNMNNYYYLKTDICIMPNDIFYPFMGVRIYDDPNITDEIIYNIIQKHTVALHWEYSQILDTPNATKKGWTQYLDILRKTPQ